MPPSKPPQLHLQQQRTPPHHFVHAPARPAHSSPSRRPPFTFQHLHCRSASANNNINTDPNHRCNAQAATSENATGAKPPRATTLHLQRTRSSSCCTCESFTLPQPSRAPAATTAPARTNTNNNVSASFHRNQSWQ
ncbi:hypothetical protein DEO72_LG4g141 [Vigna unguiculata]|uniref:Uncharacterized protein n=1 Tax=Vigna unguiculata TaxID=3917 RepID=A0A4D6LKF8_VIGUN|nr:hypothetical protein DEO72_LG4g141 [Vigna unguiculata]